MQNNKRYTPEYAKLPASYANFLERVQRGEKPKLQV